MSKLLAIILMSLMLVSCDKVDDRVDVVTGDIWIFDDTSIEIDKTYDFCDFTKEYKDGECIVTLRFKKESEDEE